jgi:hypothetical protein
VAGGSLLRQVEQTKLAAMHGAIVIGRHDVNGSGQELFAVHNHFHRHRRFFFQNFHQQTGLRGIHMKRHHIGESAPLRKFGDEVFQRRNAPRRSANADDRSLQLPAGHDIRHSLR